MSEQNDQVDEVTTSSTGRRELFTKAGAAAAVVAVAGFASSKSVEAANGLSMVIGQINSGTATTRLSGGSSFYVVDGTSLDGNTSSIRGASSAANKSGVRGEASGSDGTGVYGEASGSAGRGVYGLSGGSSGVGVYGEHLGDTIGGTGVFGTSDNGAGVTGSGTSYDLLANGNGRVGLTKSGNAGSPTDTGTIGTIARDATGNLWYCYATNKWQRLAGPAAAGAFHPISPVRVFDSRNPAFPTPGGFAASQSRVISVKDGRHKNTGAVTSANAVPVGAIAVAFNVTGTNTGGENFLAVVPGDVTSTDVSALNWSGAGISIANASVTKVDSSRQVRIIAGPGGGFDAIIDISGYYI